MNRTRKTRNSILETIASAMTFKEGNIDLIENMAEQTVFLHAIQQLPSEQLALDNPTHAEECKALMTLLAFELLSRKQAYETKFKAFKIRLLKECLLNANSYQPVEQEMVSVYAVPFQLVLKIEEAMSLPEDYINLSDQVLKPLQQELQQLRARKLSGNSLGFNMEEFSTQAINLYLDVYYSQRIKNLSKRFSFPNTYQDPFLCDEQRKRLKILCSHELLSNKSTLRILAFFDDHIRLNNEFNQIYTEVTHALQKSLPGLTCEIFSDFFRKAFDFFSDRQTVFLEKFCYEIFLSEQRFPEHQADLHALLTRFLLPATDIQLGNLLATALRDKTNPPPSLEQMLRDARIALYRSQPQEQNVLSVEETDSFFVVSRLQDNNKNMDEKENPDQESTLSLFPAAGLALFSNTTRKTPENSPVFLEKKAKGELNSLEMNFLTHQTETREAILHEFNHIKKPDLFDQSTRDEATRVFHRLLNTALAPQHIGILLDVAKPFIDQHRNPLWLDNSLGKKHSTTWEKLSHSACQKLLILLAAQLSALPDQKSDHELISIWQKQPVVEEYDYLRQGLENMLREVDSRHEPQRFEM